MKSLSLWAARNLWPARIVLVVSYLILIGMACMVSDLLMETGTGLPGTFFPLSIMLYIIAVAVYPSKKEKLYRNYFFRKGCDLVLIVCSLLMIMYTHTTGVNNFSSNIPSASAAITAPTNSTVKNKKKAVKEQLKKLRKAYKELKAAYKHGPKGARAALIILSSLVAIALVILVLSLSCSLACAGSGGAATIVGILGVTLIVFGLYKLIRAIQKKYNPLIEKSKKEKEKDH